MFLLDISIHVCKLSHFVWSSSWLHQCTLPFLNPLQQFYKRLFNFKPMTVAQGYPSFFTLCDFPSSLYKINCYFVLCSFCLFTGRKKVAKTILIRVIIIKKISFTVWFIFLLSPFPYLHLPVFFIAVLITHLYASHVIFFKVDQGTRIVSSKSEASRFIISIMVVKSTGYHVGPKSPIGV